MNYLNSFEIGVLVGVAGTYATIRFLPVLMQDAKLVGYKVWDYVRNLFKSKTVTA